MRSIRVRLLTLVVAILVLIWVVVVSFTWWRTSEEINDVLDAEMVQIARLLAVYTLHEAREEDLERFAKDLHRHRYEFPIIFQVWSAEEGLLFQGANAPKFLLLQQNIEDGYSDLFYEDKKWRLYSLTVGKPKYQIVVAHEKSLRNQIILEFITNILKPLLFSLPLVMIIWIGIDRGLAPLRWVATQVSGRNHSNLDPIPTSRVPLEVVPLVREMNELFMRLQASIDSYSRFTANAAHELRNPIAGAITQLHVAINSTDQLERQHGVEQALKGLKRLSHRLEQLLTLSRVEPAQIQNELSRVDLNTVAVEVMTEQATAALEKGVEIELREAQQVSLKGDSEFISIMLNNLTENAIRATPPGGTVALEIGISDAGPYLQLEDSGPGIAEEDRQRVFERHQRLDDTPGDGFGLGLSIVRTIAGIHSASIRMTNRSEGNGLLVKVTFPHESGASND